ncbi:fimbria/pilus outer membrane usher protein [Kosakonia sacchari]|uniref:fimbria/pilus outer membrane usher protein n=1 Tax=Kosakonia sacchari TaxID=1158459 RepID=UPI002ACE2D7F|nr:fimbria/pilus outer membrane usher protein [Kosakonia sacchari]MDZ7320050.1 fimbria/pilus outer membrane usher protein [Kosakonia sacchari]
MKRKFRHYNILMFIISVFLLCCNTDEAYSVEFNTDFLDTEDKNNVDFSRFSEAGYIMPGQYTLSLVINGHAVKDIDVTFLENEKNIDSDSSVEPCLTDEMIPLLGLTPDAAKKVGTWHNGQCADFSALSGMWMRGDLASTTLNISIPQVWIEYQDPTWLPPSRWDDGISGAMFDYNLNASATNYQSGYNSQYVSGTGTLGSNYGAWRLRGDWQMNTSRNSSNSIDNTSNFDWSRIYAYRALRQLKAKLTIGEDYIDSDLYDSWRYTGIALNSDDRMLPPRLRGYAPEVSGIARTNAKVIISQQGRVVYETTVASGPFRIQDLSDSVSGQLDVRVEEQDGTVQTFQMETASVPFLTRPGQLRYKLAAGKPSDFDHHLQSDAFTSGEFSWGLSNAWSLIGGTILAEDYNAFSFGAGRDFFDLGTISADVTSSVAKLKGDSTSRKSNQTGQSWRVRYSKKFDAINGELSLAGYRFSDDRYMSFNEFLENRFYNQQVDQDKEQYVLIANKYLTDLRASINLNWSHRTYWNRNDSDRYSISFNQYFDIKNWRNIALNAIAARTEYQGRRDDSIYLGLNIPIGNGSVSYGANWASTRLQQTAGWYQRLNNGDNYRLQVGTTTGGGEGATNQASGYYNHYSSIADLSANVSWVGNSYTSAGLSLAGGLTASPKGFALHPGGSRGSARMLISTDGISDIPVEEHGKTNRFGYAVIPDISSYYRNTMSINVNRLPEDIETAGPPVKEAALTEGAIGYSHFDVLKGAKLVANIRLEDGSPPPFGASVRDIKKRELGIVADNGVTWLAGISPDQQLYVSWEPASQCQVTVPPVIPAGIVLLPCKPASVK